MRVGVDVGGTFTKAVAVDLATREIVASAVVPTTHAAAGGVAAGVVDAVARLAADVGAERIELVTHSTTQAVNALLEGDAGEVGVIGMGRRPDVKRVEKRTRLSDVELSPGKHLRVRHEFFDVTEGLPAGAVRHALQGFADAGVAAVCVAEAFSPDDDSNETAVAQLAREAGLPVCTSTELSGLYGLELRTVTAALNASILPLAISTASFVADGVVAAGITAPVMVMRSDGGATDLAGFAAGPVRTLYSGPSASVAGALRHTGVTDAVVIEVGGTSTNIAAIRNGRPALSYVRVASHATALRSVDVRVVGVAGGSMLRVRHGRVHGIGPRSAHIAGLRYASFTDPADLDGATLEIGAPLPGDPDDYAMLRTLSGERVALTTTCAANLLGIPDAADYCAAPEGGARVAFELVAAQMKLDAATIAEHMLQAAGEEACELALTVAASAKLTQPSIVGVGGGAGGLARRVAAMLGWPLVIPPNAEVISSIGDALSLLRAERERTVEVADAATIESMMDDVEAEVVAAGASPASVEVRFEDVPERSTIRAIATGAVGLQAGALPGREESDEATILAAARDGATVERRGRFWLVGDDKRVRVLDRYGDEVVDVAGVRTDGAQVGEVFDAHIKYRGPVTLRPTVWIVEERRLVELGSFDPAADPYAGRDDVAYLVGRAR